MSGSKKSEDDHCEWTPIHANEESVRELKDAIFSYLAERNLAPKRLRVESEGRGNPGEDQRGARAPERDN